MSKTWEERLTFDQKEQVTRELREFGLDSHQIQSLMRMKGRVTESELDLMRTMPPGRRGNKATINVVRSAIRTCKVLGLLESTRGRRR